MTLKISRVYLGTTGLPVGCSIFASAARKEGLEQIAKVEEFHESRYRKLISNLEKGEVFKKKGAVKWHCINCGYVFEGEEPPRECPACEHPQAFYEVLAENF